jgi:YesN/AraC family two-component response regulator
VLVDDEETHSRRDRASAARSGLELVGEASNGEDAIEIVIDVLGF